jgi:hypothetical protein
MQQDRAIRVIKIAAVLAALLLVFTLVGSSIWHDHRGESSANCQTCHLSHQTATSHLVANQVSAPVALGTTSLPADTIRIAGPELTFSISRAPPTA